MNKRQSESNYKLRKEEGEFKDRYSCPYCENNGMYRSTKVKDQHGNPISYITDRDVEREKAKHSMYYWTEDHLCNKCGKLFSMENGC